MSRPRVPQQLHKLRGTDRPDRRARDLPRSAPDLALPVAPAWLDDHGAAKWGELVVGLAERQLLTPGPLALLEVLCAAWSSWQRAAGAVKADGTTYRKKSAGGGYLHRARPEAAMEASARKEYTGLLRSYLTLLELPAKEGPEADAFDSLLDQRSGRR